MFTTIPNLSLPQIQADSVWQLIANSVQNQYVEITDSVASLNASLHEYAAFCIYQRPSNVVDIYSYEKNCPCGGVLYHVGYVYSNGKSVENWGGEFDSNVSTRSFLAEIEFNINGQPCV